MTPKVALPNGETIPALGQGTWMMGETPARRRQEIAALRRGVERGLTLVDTAEMYGDGAAEELIAEALGGAREALFLVSKVYPHNASRAGVLAACERSLRRLKTDRIDLYLLHWRGAHPLAETVAGFEALQAAGKIRHWGVSNFDVADMAELVAAGGGACACNQILYNIGRRGPEFALAPWLAVRSIPLMAYSPVEQGRLEAPAGFAAMARRHGVDVYALALAFLLQKPGVVAIPKAGSVAHVEANARARDIVLTEQDIADIDRLFPPPQRKTPLAML